MRFTESEIHWAARLRGAGLLWDPQPGHYVFDIDGVMKAGSPFQAGVYLITSPNALETTVGGQQELRNGFAWLLTWEDCRSWLADAGVTDEELLAALAEGLAEGLSDREALYVLILDVLERAAAEADG